MEITRMAARKSVKKAKKINYRLLRRVQEHIIEEPRRLDMNLIAFRANKDNYGDDAPPCGTAGCIAGWACLLSGTTFEKASTGGWKRATKLLGLTSSQAATLFAPPAHYDNGIDSWPKKFSMKYIKAKTKRGKANVTVARIEHFIKTKGKE